MEKETTTLAKYLDRVRDLGEHKYARNYITDSITDYEGYLVEAWRESYDEPSVYEQALLSDTELETYLQQYIDLLPDETFGVAIVFARLIRLENKVFKSFLDGNYKKKILFEAALLFPGHVRYVYKSLFDKLQSFEDLIIIAVSIARKYDTPQYVSLSGGQKVRLIAPLENAMDIYITKTSPGEAWRTKTIIGKIERRKGSNFADKLYKHIYPDMNKLPLNEMFVNLCSLIFNHPVKYQRVSEINDLNEKYANKFIREFEKYFLQG